MENFVIDYLRFSIYYCSASSVPSVAQTTVLIRNTIFQLLVFYACFLNQSTVISLYVRCYETFFKKELLAFVFRRSPLFAAFARN